MLFVYAVTCQASDQNEIYTDCIALDSGTTTESGSKILEVLDNCDEVLDVILSSQPDALENGLDESLILDRRTKPEALSNVS